MDLVEADDRDGDGDGDGDVSGIDGEEWLGVDVPHPASTRPAKASTA